MDLLYPVVTPRPSTLFADLIQIPTAKGNQELLALVDKLGNGNPANNYEELQSQFTELFQSAPQLPFADFR